jgi:ribosomal protein S27AE
MQRDTYDTVTVSILIPASKEWAEGETFYDERVRVRAFTDDDLDQKSESGRETWRQIPEWTKSEILNIVAVIRALESNDEVAAEKAILALKSRAGPLVFGIVKASLKEPEYKQDTLVKELCSRLEEVRLVLWKTQGRLAPGLLCSDIRAAFFVHVLMSAVGARASLRLCPKCGNTFMQKRADQEYCSVKCREAHRVERWRARNSEASKINRAEEKKPVRRRRKK